MDKSKKYLVFSVLVITSTLMFSGVAVGETGNSCIDCHTSLADKQLREPATGLEEDVHAVRGLFCHDCHGGNPNRGFFENDPKLAHSARDDYRGVPQPTEIPEFCARCHGDVEYMKRYNPKLRVDQLLEYRSSRHGKLIAEGDQKVAQCVSCHGVHGILPVTDSRSPVHRNNIPGTCGNCHADPGYMREYRIPTDQLAEYTGSVHGKLLLEEGESAAPACNDCHGNHGATPPGLNSIANACGECHALNRDLFNQSPHKAAYAEMELGECITCHGHHDVEKTSDEMFGVGEESMCITCHDEGDAGYTAAGLMRAQLDSLIVIIEESSELLERAEQGGVDVKHGRFDLQKPQSALVKARGAVHGFDPEAFAAIIHPAIAEARIVKEVGETALRDLWMRRVGLAFSIPLILLVALGLWMKIRRIESRKKS
jgi:hypothetical protein